MEAKAIAKYVRMSPTKVGVVLGRSFFSKLLL